MKHIIRCATICILSLLIGSLYSSNRKDNTSALISVYALNSVQDKERNHYATYEIDENNNGIIFFPPHYRERHKFIKNNDPKTIQFKYIAYYGTSMSFHVYLQSLVDKSQLPIIAKNPESQQRLGLNLCAIEATASQAILKTIEKTKEL